MLEVTDSAQRELKKILEDAKLSNPGIRVFASSDSCCCGPSYGISITENAMEGDKLLEKEGLKIFIDPAAYDDLAKAVIDFTDEERGFVIQGLESSECSSGCCS
jgi:iron-sulfur cluster assembly accessory protein